MKSSARYFSVLLVVLSFGPTTSVISAQQQICDAEGETCEETFSIQSPVSNESTWTIVPTGGNSMNAPYNFYMKKNHVVYKTFFEEIAAVSNQSINIQVSGASSQNLILLFDKNNPESFSVSHHGINHQLSCAVPNTGKYVVIINSLEDSFLCDVTVNGFAFHDKIVSNNLILIQQDTSQVYNTFTWNSSGNVALCVIDTNSRVSAFNDNFGSTGAFDWGVEARVQRQYNSTAGGVMVIPANDANCDTLTTDLFVKCGYPDYCVNYFYSLNGVDAISSCPSNGFMTDIYNCFAWAGGCWFAWIDPTTIPDVEYNPQEGGFLCLDYWLRDCGYMSEGATEENSDIDMYFFHPFNQNPRIVSHMTVRSNTNYLSYGYAWESKLGELDRIMHPRYSLVGNYSSTSVDGYTHGYGEVYMHYRYGTPNYTPADFVFENVSFSQDELNEIENECKNIPSFYVSLFDDFYRKCVDHFKKSMFGSVEMLTIIDDYQTLIRICRERPALLFKAFKKVADGDIVACRIVHDLTVDDNFDIIRKISLREINDSQKEKVFVRSLTSKTTAYIKYLLHKQKYGRLQEELEEKSYSDSDIMHLTNCDNGINVNFTVNDESNVTLMIATINGDVKLVPINKQRYIGGNYSEYIPLGNGAYVVTLLVNNDIFYKKIILN